MKQTAITIATAMLAFAAVPVAASLPADVETSYGYLRTVEGPGRVVQAASGASIEIEANYPVLAGDLIEVDPGGRVELSLPDFNVVQLAGGTELLLARLALSAETEDGNTALRLLRGEIHFLVHDLLAVTGRPRVDTANATIYLQSSGVYRIASDGYGWTELVVRQGFAEIATEAGSSVVRSGEQAWIEGGRWPRVDIARAGGLDDLERWGADLELELSGYGEPPVEDRLAYSAAPLARHGSWVSVDGYRAWRPAVATSWRPYEAGYWADTPTGMVWVSSEPWAWVTYHYGSWVPSPSYGWVWRPGYRFAPAWVYWYWGPSYVAWVPVGYYSNYYRHYGRGFRFGIHGWAGGSWSYFADWTFCSTRSYRGRDLRRHVRRGHHLARDTRSYALERGLITTDSRFEARQRVVRRAGADRPGGDSLPDVTAFVARRRDLPSEVSERIFSDRRAVAREEVWERPEGVRRIAARARAPVTGGTVSGNTVSRGTVSTGTASGAAVPRAGTRETIEAWRRESGRLRTGASPAEPSAAPRARPITPTRPSGDRAGWWENRPNRAAPRGAAPIREGSRGTAARPGEVRAPGAARPPVVRRVWEGIRDRQRALPSSPRSSAGTSPPGRAPEARPQSAPSRRAPEARPQSAPSRRAPEARPPAAPSRRAPAAQRRSEPPRRSSTEGRSSPQRRTSSARSSEGGSSARSSASARSGSSRSSSRSRTARRRPPG